MQIKTIEQPKTFQPVTIQLTFESESELREFKEAVGNLPATDSSEKLFVYMSHLVQVHCV